MKSAHLIPKESLYSCTECRAEWVPVVELIADTESVFLCEECARKVLECFKEEEPK